MVRTKTKIGDVFSVKITENTKKYFQYISNDITQLNSDVIRAFKKNYPIDHIPEISLIVNDEVDFYVHCVIKVGIKMNLWEKVGNTSEIGMLSKIIFKDTNDYGSIGGGQQVRISENWHVWKINDTQFTKVGKLEGENRKAFMGLVTNPLGVIELLKGNRYPIYYPDFE